MRRGVAGVRLCDRGSCPERWPCVAHGTARIGSYEHLGKHAGHFVLSGCPQGDGDVVLDMKSCLRCGVALCSCKLVIHKPVQCGFSTREFMKDLGLRPGWTFDGESYFNNSIALRVGRIDNGNWFIQANGGLWPLLFVHECQKWHDADDAMRLAESFALNCEREQRSLRHGIDFRVDGDDNAGALGA